LKMGDCSCSSAGVPPRKGRLGRAASQTTESVIWAATPQEDSKVEVLLDGACAGTNDFKGRGAIL